MPVAEARGIHYLSVHDLVWIAGTVLGTTPCFEYERLEACMAAQYGYGDSRQIAKQGACLLKTFAKSRPFGRGNARTAFLATTAFLAANGFELIVSDEEASNAVSELFSGRASASDVVARLYRETGLALRENATLRSLVGFLCNRHASVLKALAAGDE